MKVKRKVFSASVGVCFFLMSGVALAQTSKPSDTLPKEKKIDEVVLVGYKTQRKETLASSVSTINADQLKDVTTSSFQTMMQGKMPGVVVGVSGGQPGSAPDMRIRGVSSIQGAVSPLYVVDGVIVHSAPIIPPDQISEVSVLKDAAATALYGSRSGGGVVVITTKNGKGNSISVSGKTSINFFNQGPNFNLMYNTLEKLDHYLS